MTDFFYKAEKHDVAYTPKAKNHKERCELCCHYQPSHACSVVRGRINPEGWCKRFEAS